MSRILSLLLTFVTLMLLAPLMLIIALLIKISMPGPVLFKQTRIGYGGKPFTIFKFRSMKLNSSKTSITLSTDHRITSFGQFIRITKIDELPQLFNILKGDMNIVGPRPDVPGYYDTLKGENQLIWTLLPGLTGLDSMFYPNEQSILDYQPNPEEYYDNILWPDKVCLNLWYARNRSLALDIKIILNTASQLLFKSMIFKINPTHT